MRNTSVLIENPLAGGRKETTINRARRFVSSGRAVFTVGEKVIRFINEEKKVKMACSIDQIAQVRVTGRNYDQLHGQWVQHARNIPVIQPHKIR